jgi:hypothetical protein
MVGRRRVLAERQLHLPAGTGAGVIGVRGLDARPIGTGRCGPVTEKLAQLHRELAASEGVAINT